MTSQNVKEIRLIYLDKYGAETSFKEAVETRLSVFFDYGVDNHHVQFKSCCNRTEIITALDNLAMLITKHRINQEELRETIFKAIASPTDR